MDSQLISAATRQTRPRAIITETLRLKHALKAVKAWFVSKA